MQSTPQGNSFDFNGITVQNYLPVAFVKPARERARIRPIYRASTNAQLSVKNQAVLCFRRCISKYFLYFTTTHGFCQQNIMHIIRDK